MYNKFMNKALQLAQKGSGYTNPNPLVGAVLVKDNLIIGEGYHQYYGGPHAEINALKNAADNLFDITGATLYVTLEPCSHYGKTPPCVKEIIGNRIAKVVVGMLDPNPIVAGNGLKILKEQGIEVITGILEDKAKKLNEIYIKYITTKLPFCILKIAMTLDGKIATTNGDSKWISTEKSRKYVHEIRHKVSAILVGIGTILADNPKLTTRLENCSPNNIGKGKDPVRIIVDSSAKIPLESTVLNLASSAETIIATTKKADKHKLKAIKEKGAGIIITPLKNGKVDLNFLMQTLGEQNIDSILIEGGSTLNYSALEEGIVDKVISFIAPKIIGGASTKTPVGGEGEKYIRNAILLDNIRTSMFDEDVMIEGYIRKEE